MSEAPLPGTSNPSGVAPASSSSEKGYAYQLAAVVVGTARPADSERWLANESAALAAVQTAAGLSAELEVSGAGAFAVTSEWDEEGWDTERVVALAQRVQKALKEAVEGSYTISVGVQGRRHSARVASGPETGRPFDGEVLLAEHVG